MRKRKSSFLAISQGKCIGREEKGKKKMHDKLHNLLLNLLDHFNFSKQINDTTVDSDVTSPPKAKDGKLNGKRRKKTSESDSNQFKV